MIQLENENGELILDTLTEIDEEGFCRVSSSPDRLYTVHDLYPWQAWQSQ